MSPLRDSQPNIYIKKADSNESALEVDNWLVLVAASAAESTTESTATESAAVNRSRVNGETAAEAIETAEAAIHTNAESAATEATKTAIEAIETKTGSAEVLSISFACRE